MLGKRKREAIVARRQIPHEEQLEEQLAVEDESIADRELFRKHFESMFGPLAEFQAATPSLVQAEAESYEASEEDESEWEGLSESESCLEQEDVIVEVIEHRTDTQSADDIESQRQHYKTFMVST